jgi:hypothetical protein
MRGAGAAETVVLPLRCSPRSEIDDLNPLTIARIYRSLAGLSIELFVSDRL